MSDYVGALNHFADAWAAIMWRACWQGALAIGLVWSICRAWPKLPQSLCCWLWRLAHLKTVLLLLWVTPIALPLLPNAPLSSGSAPREQTEQGTSNSTSFDSRFLHKKTAGVLSVQNASRNVSVIASKAPSQRAGSSNGYSNNRWPGASAIQLLIWLAGVSWYGLQIWRKRCFTRSLRRSCRAVEDEALLSLYTSGLQQFPLRRPPQLMTSSGTGSPLLMGLVQPVIVLPDSLVTNCTQAELKLMLAHEMAHFRRRDLLWNYLLLIAHGLFFFHPALWLGQAQWRLTQEMACDELVLTTGDCPARDYGKMLLKVAAQGLPRATGQLGTVSVVESYAILERRLEALQCVAPRRTLLAASVVLTTVGIAAVVPVRLTGQEQRPIDKYVHKSATSLTRPEKLQSKVERKGQTNSRVVRMQLADARLTGTQKNFIKFDPGEGYYLVSVADGLGRTTYLSLLLCPDAATIKQLGYWPDDNKIQHATLPRLRTGWGINIGDTSREVQRKLGLAPDVSGYDRRRKLRVYIYKAPLALKFGGTTKNWQYTGKYTFHNERLRVIQYSAQSFDGE